MKSLVDLKKHKEFPKLNQLIDSTQSKNSFNNIQVNGLPFVLQASLVSTLSDTRKTSVIYSTRDTQELRRYIDTLYSFKLPELSHSEVLNILSNYGFNRVYKIEKIGEFEVKGDIISFWPVGYAHPIRISFFGDDFENAKLYDEIYGRRYEEITEILIGENHKLESSTTRESLKIYKPELVLPNSIIIFSAESVDTDIEANFDFSYAQLFFQRFDLLETEVEKWVKEGYKIIISSKHKKVLPKSIHKFITAEDLKIDAGFESASMKILVLTDRELFGTVFLSREVKKISSKKARQLLASLEGEIEIDDYVVHEDHGIGIYKGIKQEKTEEKVKIGLGEYEKRVKSEDYLLIAYAQGDELYVPLNQIDKVTKYISPEDRDPKITRLSKVEWLRLKKKVKESVAKLAKELVQHYAKRELSKAPEIHDHYKEYDKFIKAFPYQETEDQLRTEKDVVKDLSSEKSMNRLIVGDVGFGKTEIAMRAAFKVASNGYQVAVLCPTTVLASQHENVFKERFKGTGIKIASMSRLSTRTNTEIVEGLETGKIDIVVGTHRILSNDMKFNKLGLLVIDEEQKFGVKQKEKLKKLEHGVHVLSMSATPIPRSLSMALASIQDISLIQTPPEGRQAIQTNVSRTSPEKIANAILQEIKRGGQVYYVHNRVRTIHSVFAKLSKLLPNVRFAVAHGQMSPNKLEKTIKGFYNNEYDCLICTTIIENGIDMSNVNTIIIEHAQNFGLGQLYQLRGRVGRGDRQAFAHLFYDGENIDKKDDDSLKVQETQDEIIIRKAKNKKYKERLKSIKEASELGSGFKLASRDLEIRRAGNLLGKEQHGNINYIGYGLYMQMLAEEIEKLKQLSKHE